jgi:tetrahydromethanopterin S-methyltransferase subunit B
MGEGVSEVSGMTEQEMCGLLIKLNERVEMAATLVKQLYHVLLEGNGTPPITVQVATIDTRLSSLEKTASPLTVQVATMDTRLIAMEQSGKDYRIPRHVWLGIVVSAIIGLIGIVVSIKNLH